MNSEQQLFSRCPIDGRYKQKLDVELGLDSSSFTEYQLIADRVWIEIQYLIQYYDTFIRTEDTPQIPIVPLIERFCDKFSVQDALRIKEIEKTTNHDVKAVEYFIKEELDKMDLSKYKNYVHFGLTSQDINSIAYDYRIRDFVNKDYISIVDRLVEKLYHLRDENIDQVMLSRTHGQPATPTRVGMFFGCYWERLNNQLGVVRRNADSMKTKFGGAVGCFNAHALLHKNEDIEKFADDFVFHTFGLERNRYTSQINSYDGLCNLFYSIIVLNNILLDFSQNMWLYISNGYFTAKAVDGEIGSSTMPHKVNTIRLEQADGSIALSNGIFTSIANKLATSRYQRDISDSILLRTVGEAFSFSLLAVKGILDELSRIGGCNKEVIEGELMQNYVVVAEAIQILLKSYGVEDAYERVSKFTRGRGKLTQQDFHNFIDRLGLVDYRREELKSITPLTYCGITPNESLY